MEVSQERGALLKDRREGRLAEINGELNKGVEDPGNWRSGASVTEGAKLRAAGLPGLPKTIRSYQSGPRLVGTFIEPSCIKNSIFFVQSLCRLTLQFHGESSMPGFPVLHYLPEFTQTHIH